MLNKAVIQLYIPDVLQYLDIWHKDFLFEVDAPHISELLTLYTKEFNENVLSLNSAFFNNLHLKIDELPIAYYRYLVQKNEEITGIMCADPVYLEVGMNDVILTNRITDLSNKEANELIEILNDHFTQDGLRFIFGSNRCWYIAFPESESIKSHDLNLMLMQNIVDKSIQSELRNWKVIQNETQMLLHGSDVNKQREIAGLQTVNSLWFWGAGKPQVPKIQVGKIYSHENESSMLQASIFAKAADCETSVLPEDVLKTLDQDERENTVLVLLLDQLVMPALENNLDEFQNQLHHIDNKIIKPLLQAWQKDQIDIVIDCCDGTVLKPLRKPAWKFWLKPQKLRDITKN